MKRKNRKGTGTGIIIFVVLCFFGIVTYGKINLEKEKKELDNRKSALEKQIIEETERSVEIKNIEAYVQTKRYIEKMAREKLGLVYEDEIIIREDNNNNNNNN